ncbi:MAG: hypothetical protein ACYDCX_10675 [Acidithiobacillus sp.]
MSQSISLIIPAHNESEDLSALHARVLTVQPLASPRPWPTLRAFRSIHR